jgi:hypothetical protein
MKKTKSFVCFEMLEENKKFERLFFGFFQVENKVMNMCKISCLHPIKQLKILSQFEIENPKNLFGKEAYIQKLTFMGLSPR